MTTTNTTVTTEQVTLLDAELTNPNYTPYRVEYTANFIKHLLNDAPAPEDHGWQFEAQARENVLAILEGRDAARVRKDKKVKAKAQKAQDREVNATTTTRRPGRPKNPNRPAENVAGEAYANKTVGKIDKAKGNRKEWMQAYSVGKAAFLASQA